MSIIHDALKKIQRGLTPKTDETLMTSNETPAPQTPANLFVTPPPPETLTPAEQQVIDQKPPVQNAIKTFLALICSIAITAGSIWYLYKQFQHDIPVAQRMAKKSFYQMIHKEEIPEFKTKAPQDLKPLAKITIPPPAITASDTVKPSDSVTLNIHGVMSNATGNLVLINDQVYQEGDEVDGAKILKINLNSITVLINGAEKTIRVKN